MDVKGLAFDGQRALWAGVEYGRDSAEGSVVTAAANDRRQRILSYLDRSPTYLVDDDRTPLVYSWAGEATWQVVGRSQRQLQNVPPLRDFSVAAGRIALVAAGEATTSVEIRRLSDGVPLGSVPVVDEVRTLALSSQTLAVFLEGAFGKRIERYDVATRTLVASTPVPANAVASLDFGAGGVIVFRAGRTIWRLAPSGQTTRMWTTRRTPIDVSVEGRRVVWAANGGGRGRVLALTLPRGPSP